MSDPAETPAPNRRGAYAAPSGRDAAEIEDVLSAIRRLVSESQPGPDGTMRPRPKAPAPAPQPDRLVLTPSLRVADPEDPWTPVHLRDPDTVNAPNVVPTVLDAMPADEPAEAEQADGGAEFDPSLWSSPDTGADAGPDAGFDAGEAGADDLGLARGEDATPTFQPDDRLAAFGAIPDEPEGEEAAAEPDDGVSGFSVEAAVSEALQDQLFPSSDFEPETGDLNWPDDSAVRAAHDLAAARGSLHAHETPEPDVAPDVALDDDDTRETGDAPVFSRRFAAARAGGGDPDENDITSEAGDRLAEAVWGDMAGAPVPGEAAEPVEEPGPGEAAFETVEAIGIEDEIVPPEASSPHMAPPDDIPFEDRFPDHTGSPEVSEDIPASAEIEDFGDQTSPFTFPDAEGQVIDEETLREIIADVVREELQGPLGQRITRNVRKMVRREIRLVLAASELD